MSNRGNQVGMRFHPPAKFTKIRYLSREKELRALLAKSEPWIVVDEGAPPPFELEGRGIFRVPGGEGGKRWAQLEKILAWLASQKAERTQPLLVVGGGAVLDLGALAASLYKRGMPLVLLPTTLLGMVDATLGGKTAIDMESGGQLLKNFAGTFYPAQEVWVFPEFLSTLDQRERVSGAGEVLKTLWIKGGKWDAKPLFTFAAGGDASAGLLKLVRACLEFKAKVVQRDPLDDKRIREVLNFGHTAGHALESASALSHGECVLWGMAVESFLLASQPMLNQCLKAISELELKLPAVFEAGTDWEKFLGADKKIKGGKLEMSLLAAPGKVVKRKYSTAQVAAALRAFPEFVRHA